MGKHLEQALPSVYTLQCLTGKVDNNQLMRQPVRETRTVHASPCISEKRQEKRVLLKQFFRPSFLAAASLAENTTLFCCWPCELVGFNMSVSGLCTQHYPEKMFRENFLSPKCAQKKISPGASPPAL